MAIAGDSHRVADLFETIYAALGTDPETEFTTDFRSPTTITNKGKVIEDLL